MRRKLVKQGRNALTVTLPAGWSRANRLAPGDEVEVFQEGSSIIITPEEVREAEKKIEYDITALDRSSFSFIYTSLYESGYDGIRFTFRKPDTADYRSGRKVLFSDIITRYTSRLEGFAIISQGSNHYVIKDISRQSPDEFDNVLRRVFFLILEFNEQILKGLNSKTFLSSEKGQEMHDNISKFIRFCIRLLNKKMASAAAKYSLYHIIKCLDNIVDHDKWLCRDLAGTMKLSKVSAGCLKRTIGMFRQAYDAYYSSVDEKMPGMIKEWHALEKAVLAQGIPAREIGIVTRYSEVSNIVTEMLRSILTLRRLLAAESSGKS